MDADKMKDLVLRSFIKEAGEVFRKEDYIEATKLYSSAKKVYPNESFLSMLDFNIEICKRRAKGSHVSKSVFESLLNNLDENGIVVYSCLFGNYESVKEIVKPNPAVRYIMFTDDKTFKSNTWEPHFIDINGYSPSRISRLPKILAHKFLPKHNISIYIDATVEFDCFDINSMVESCLGLHDIALYPHYVRNCVYDEVAECHKLGKISDLELSNAVNFLEAKRFPKRIGLYENAFIIRKNTPLISRLNELWAHYYFNGVHRDQFYLVPAAFKLEVPIAKIRNSNNFRHSPYLNFYPHKHLTVKEDIRGFNLDELFAKYKLNLNQINKDYLISQINKKFKNVKTPYELMGRDVKGGRNIFQVFSLLSDLKAISPEDATKLEWHINKMLFSDVAYTEKKKNTIAYLANSPMPTLAANNVHVMKKCAALSSFFDKVTLVTQAAENSEITKENIFETFNVNQTFDIDFINEVADQGDYIHYKMVVRAIKAGAEVVITRSTLAALLCVLADIPVLLERHRPMASKELQILDYLSRGNSFKGLIVITKSLVSCYSGINALMDNKVYMFPDAADAPKSDQTWPLLDYKKGKINLGYVGHLYPGKGAEIAVEIAKHYQECHVHMLGGWPEDVEKWRSETTDLQNITFYGHANQNDVSLFLNTIDVAIAPFLRTVKGHGNSNIGSYFSPLKIFEYMAHRKAIISSDLPVLREVLNHKSNSLLCDPDDINEWVDAIDLIRKDKTLKTSLEAKAFQDFCESYSWEQRASKVHDIFHAYKKDETEIVEKYLKVSTTPRQSMNKLSIFFEIGPITTKPWAYEANLSRMVSSFTSIEQVEKCESNTDVVYYFDIEIAEKYFKPAENAVNVLRVGGLQPVFRVCGRSKKIIREKLFKFDVVIALSPEIKIFLDGCHPNVIFIPNFITEKDTSSEQSIHPEKAFGAIAANNNMRNKVQKNAHILEDVCCELDVLVCDKGENYIPKDVITKKFFSRISTFIHFPNKEKEGCSNVVMEALANRIPCITSEYAGLHNSLNIKSLATIRLSSDHLSNIQQIKLLFNDDDVYTLQDIHCAKRAEIAFTSAIDSALDKKKKSDQVKNQPSLKYATKNDTLKQLVESFNIKEKPLVIQNNANRAICDFLWYGFLPSKELASEARDFYTQLFADNSIATFEPDDLSSVKGLLEQIISEELSSRDLDIIRIGVSSGLDSRALLGAVTNLLPKNRIYPFTTGHPGHRDFDLAPILIGNSYPHYQRVNVVHKEPTVDVDVPLHMPLSGVTFNAQVVKDKATAKGMVPNHIPILHGFLNGPLIDSGRRGSTELNTKDQAVDFFVKKNRRYFKGFDSALINLFPEWYNPAESLDVDVLEGVPELSYVDKLDLYYRQFQLIGLYSAPKRWSDQQLKKLPYWYHQQALVEREKLICPFADPRWQKSFLTAKAEYRVDASLFKNFIRKFYSDVFPDFVRPNEKAFSSASNTTNISWGELWKNNESFRSSVTELLSSLQGRGLWFDPMLPVAMYEYGLDGYKHLMQGLVALELNIRAGRLPEPNQNDYRPIFD